MSSSQNVEALKINSNRKAAKELPVMGQEHTGSPPETPVEPEVHAGRGQEEAVQQPQRHCNSQTC